VPRKTRENEIGGIYHVYARGNDRAPIYLDGIDRSHYLDRLERVVAQMEWVMLSYCLMDNHLHLLVETPNANLSDGMRALHGGYAQWFNVRHERVGHLFQGRYGATLMRTDSHVCVAAAYIARNPVRAGLCARPETWEWSSYGAMASGREMSWVSGPRLLSFFAPQSDIARRQYVEMAELVVRPLE
jgi:putative transposase